METFLSLGTIGGMPVIVWSDDPHEREASETDDGKNPFELIANAEDSVSLMNGFEAFELPPIAPYMPRAKIDAPPEPRALVAAMGANPTPAKVRAAADSVRIWGASGDLPECPQYFIPVSECMDMARDLKAVCSVYAYSIGECSDAMLRKNLAGGIRFMDFGSDSEGSEGALYENHVSRMDDHAMLRSWALFRNAEGKMLSRQPEGTRTLLFQYGSDTIAHECRGFGGFAMNSFMKDAAPCIADDGSFSPRGGHGFGKAYAYFAEALCNGKASVCDYCGNVFTRRRSTKRYCSDSCKVAMSKAGLTNTKADPAR